MALALGDIAPDFQADTTEGPISFHEWLGDSWGVLFSHPKDFTPICTTELGYMAKVKPEFDRRGVKIIAVSVDPVDSHGGWARDIEETQGTAPNYPIIGDSDFKVSKAYGMLGADVSGRPADRTAADNQTVRNVFVVGPDKKIKLILVYPMTTGRNFDEVLRVIDSLQLTAKHKVATPVNWKPGEDVIIAGSVSNDEAKELWPDGWESPKPYIRIVPAPTAADRTTCIRASVRPGARSPSPWPRPPYPAVDVDGGRGDWATIPLMRLLRGGVLAALVVSATAFAAAAPIPIHALKRPAHNYDQLPKVARTVGAVAVSRRVATALDAKHRPYLVYVTLMKDKSVCTLLVQSNSYRSRCAPSGIVFDRTRRRSP